jgi:CheY-like chemotaxis protein
MSSARRRLLIVDEYPQTRETAPTVYGHYGYEIRVAATANEAVEAVRTFHPDAVILEWFFRQGLVSGLAARLRSAAADRQRPLVVIALSVFDEPPDFQQREVVDDYFVKPTPADVIDRAIRARLDANR